MRSRVDDEMVADLLRQSNAELQRAVLQKSRLIPLLTDAELAEVRRRLVPSDTSFRSEGFVILTPEVKEALEQVLGDCEWLDGPKSYTRLVRNHFGLQPSFREAQLS